MKNQFNKAIKNLKKQMVDSDELYMADKNNWLLVHCTHYMPQINKNGELVIQNTAAATDGEIPRATVHFTLNHTVVDNNGGSWTDKGIVVLAPYDSVVEKNNKPAGFKVDDTFFSVGADAGLVLPENARIVKPVNNGPLYQIGEKVSTYKTDNFTDDEIELIKSWMPNWTLRYYDRYDKGDVDDAELQIVLQLMPAEIVKSYEMAKDKKAFIRGFYEEKKYEILNSVLRDKVVAETAKKMGYRTISRNETNLWDVDRKIQSVALQDGLYITSHAGTFYSVAEDYGLYLDNQLDELSNVERNDDLINLLYKNTCISRLVLTNETDYKGVMYSQYEKKFTEYLKDYKENGRTGIDVDALLKQPFGKRILKFDKNLYKILQKNSDVMAKKIEKTFKILDKKFGMKEIKKYLNTKIYSDVEKSWRV